MAYPSDAKPELDLCPLRASGQVYLDYTGAALYCEAVLREHSEILTRQLFGNPHSTHQASLASTLAAGVAREAVFHFLDADYHDYDIVWTANASSAIRLIESRRVSLEPLVSDVVPLAGWERAFAATRVGSGIKFVIDPSI